MASLRQALEMRSVHSRSSHENSVIDSITKQESAFPAIFKLMDDLEQILFVN